MSIPGETLEMREYTRGLEMREYTMGLEMRLYNRGNPRLAGAIVEIIIIKFHMVDNVFLLRLLGL